MDESYFGARRVRGKRARGASGKTIVFGLLKRNNKVYTQIIPDAKKATLQAIIRGKIRVPQIFLLGFILETASFNFGSLSIRFCIFLIFSFILTIV